jgi:acetyltransferase-like isoleucine patch superfamily enzyme/SAM-dependent methyltransferase
MFSDLASVALGLSTMNFAILVVSPPEYKHSQAFAEVAETLHFGLIALGYQSVICDRVLPEHRHIVLGVNLLQFFPVDLPDDSILYNFEQISPDSPWITAAMLEVFQRYILWDYSLENCVQLCLMGCEHVLHVPLGYVPELTRIVSVPEADREIDVLFYGSPTEERTKVLETLRQKGLKVVELAGVYGTERDSAISNAKIILNIHAYKAQIFEIVRVSYLLANRAFIISEESSNDPQAQALQDGIAFAQYDDLVETCLHFLEHPQERQLIAEKGFQLAIQNPEPLYLEQALQNTQQPPKEKVRIDLGCGPRKAPGFIGVDIFPAPGVDIVADLSTTFPFEDSSVDVVRAHDFIEHLPDRLRTMNEIWRICKDGALVDLFVPSSDGRGAFQDPTHVSFWNLNSFQYFTVEHPAYLELCQCYGFRGAFRLVSLKQYESPDNVIHIHALLKAVKDDPTTSIGATLAALPRKPINIIIFPGWQQPEETISAEVKDILRELSLHPDKASIALLVDTTDFPTSSENTPEAFVSYSAMELLFSEEIDISEGGPEIAFVQCLNSEIWNFLAPRLSYHLALPHENPASVLTHKIQTVQPLEIEGFRQKPLLLRFGIRPAPCVWLKDKIQGGPIDVGDYSYADGDVNWVVSNPEDRIEVGKFCVISPNVSIFGGGEHFTQRATTYPFKFLFLQDDFTVGNPDATTKGITQVGHDVRIGQSAIVLSGVTVGHGAIIGAGAVVSRDVPPYAIVAGNPAQVIRYRFSPSTIDFLLNLQWWEWSLEKILLNLDLLYQNPEQWPKTLALR